MLAPLHLATFDPDVVVCYGNSAQITRFVQGALYKVGGYIESRFAGRGACGGEITVPYSQDKCNVIVPGGGERVFALTGDAGGGAVIRAHPDRLVLVEAADPRELRDVDTLNDL